MNLAEIRSMFVQLTGRYDLEDENRADVFINSGIRTLDRKANLHHTQDSRFFREVRSVERLIHIPQCWRVHDILARKCWIENTYVRLQHLARPGHLTRLSRFQRGFPRFYSAVTTRNEAQLDKLRALQLQVPANLVDTGDWNGHTLAIEIFPWPEEDWWIEVHGKFWSPALVDDADTNLWSQLYPDLLVKAACHNLEVFYRNTEGANDWMNAIMDELVDLEQMEVDNHIQPITVMEG